MTSPLFTSPINRPLLGLTLVALGMSLNMRTRVPPAVRPAPGAMFLQPDIRANSARFRLQYPDRVGTRWTTDVVCQHSWTTYDRNSAASSTSMQETDLTLENTVSRSDGRSIALETAVTSERRSFATRGGAPRPTPPGFLGQTARSTLRGTGEILSHQPIPGLDVQTLHLVLPDQPVAVGETWTTRLPAGRNLSAGSLTVRCQLVKITRMAGRPCARISWLAYSDSPSTGGSGLERYSGEGTFDFSLSEGIVVRKSVILTVTSLGAPVSGDRTSPVRAQHTIRVTARTR